MSSLVVNDRIGLRSSRENIYNNQILRCYLKPPKRHHLDTHGCQKLQRAKLPEILWKTHRCDNHCLLRITKTTLTKEKTPLSCKSTIYIHKLYTIIGLLCLPELMLSTLVSRRVSSPPSQPFTSIIDDHSNVPLIRDH